MSKITFKEPRSGKRGGTLANLQPVMYKACLSTRLANKFRATLLPKPKSTVLQEGCTWFLHIVLDAPDGTFQSHRSGMVMPWRVSGWSSMTTSNDSCEAGLSLPPVRSRWIGSIQWGDRLTELSGWLSNRGGLRAGESAAFAPGNSNEIRQIGQVVCFCNHVSIQERWKLCLHVGMIRRISFSLYSPKHMEHLWEKRIKQDTCYLFDTEVTCQHSAHISQYT
jgi:hypothetical protein